MLRGEERTPIFCRVCYGVFLRFGFLGGFFVRNVCNQTVNARRDGLLVLFLNPHGGKWVRDNDGERRRYRRQKNWPEEQERRRLGKISGKKKQRRVSEARRGVTRIVIEALVRDKEGHAAIEGCGWFYHRGLIKVTKKRMSVRPAPP